MLFAASRQVDSVTTRVLRLVAGGVGLGTVFFRDFAGGLVFVFVFVAAGGLTFVAAFFAGRPLLLNVLNSNRMQ